MKLPTVAELRDPDRRETWLAEVMIAVSTGEMKTQQANFLIKASKEMRDSADLRAMTAEVDACRALFKEFLARKAALTVADVEDAWRRVQREIEHGADDSDGD